MQFRIYNIQQITIRQALVGMAYRVVTLVNTARASPQETGARLYHNLKPTFKGNQMNAFEKNIDTFQGLAAVEELKNYLSSVRSVHSLVQSPSLNRAAQQIARQKGLTGDVTNQKPRVINQKISKTGKVQGKVGSLVCLRTTSAEQAVAQLLIDDGLVSRKRRRMLLDSQYKYIGVGSANHTLYGNILIILLAQKITQ